MHRWAFVLTLIFGLSPAAPAADAPRPNVLFLLIDDLAPELGCYGDSVVQSPNIDRLAAGGIRFDRAYASVTVCGASRASLLTGLHPTRDRFTRFDSRAAVDAPDVPTIPQWFKDHGYVSISNGKVFHHADDSRPAWSPRPWRPKVSHAKTRDPASDDFRGGNRDRGPFYESADVEDDAYFDGLVATKTIRDLEKLQDVKKPFFLAAGFIRPHLPFYAPRKYWDRYVADSLSPAEYRDRPIDAPEDLRGSGEIRFYSSRGLKYNDDRWHRTARHGYLACVSYVDAQVGRVMDALERTGHADDTIVVLCGDHGFHLGDHDLWGKLTLLHRSTRVPLIVRYPPGHPAATAGVNSDAVVSLVDLYPTLCKAAGLEPPTHVQGTPLPVDGPNDDEAHDSAYCRMFDGDTVITDDAILTRYRGGASDDRLMLFDLDDDPLETRNVAGDPAQAERVAELTERLDRYIATAESFVPDHSIRILPLGDSITRGRNGERDFTGGYRRPLERRLDDAFGPAAWKFVGQYTNDSPDMDEVRHQGVGGITIAAVLKGNFHSRRNLPAGELMTAMHPDVVILNLGTNDLSRASADEAFKRYDKLRRLILKSDPDVVIVSNTLLGRHGKPNVHERYVAFNDLLRSHRERWEADGRYHLVDLAPIVDVATPDDLPDGVHPARRIYDVIADRYFEALRPILTARKSFTP